MHRSGTSVLARFLNMMGVYFGPEDIGIGASHENPKGFWERKDVRKLNDYVLHSLSCDWNIVSKFNLENISPETIQDFSKEAEKIVLNLDAHRPWFIKEPRMCLLSELWNHHLEVPVFLHVYRNPLEVASSLKVRNGIPIHVGVALWEYYTILALKASKEKPLVWVSHRKLMMEPIIEVGHIYEKLSEYGVKGIRKPSDVEITAFINNDLYRERYSESALYDVLNAKQLKLFEYLTRKEKHNETMEFSLSDMGYVELIEYDASNIFNRLENGNSIRRKGLEKEGEGECVATHNRKSIDMILESVEGLKKKLNEGKSEEEINRLQENLSDVQRKYDLSKAEIKELTQSKNEIVSILNDDLKTLEDKIEKLERALKVIRNSASWVIGNSIVKLKNILMMKKREGVSPIDYSFEIINGYNDWKKSRFSEPPVRVTSDINVSDNGNKVSDNKGVEIVEEDNGGFYEPVSDDVFLERIKEYNSYTGKKRGVIYTAIVGNYDVLKTPEELNPEYDYVCFTDCPILDHPVWKFKPLTYHNSDATRVARYYKLHPHFYFTDYEVSIWVDANILIKKDIRYLESKFLEENNPLGIFDHYKRHCLYEEGEECIKRKMDNAGVIERQLERYNDEGLPKGLGLPETNILICRPNDSLVQKIYTTWWMEVDNNSKRDQISVMYALWKNNASYTPLVDSVSKMARYDKENFHIFEHKNKVSGSNPLKYKVPNFLKNIYEKSINSWIDILSPFEVTDSDLWEYRNSGVDIIIPVHNAIEDVKECLKSVDRTLLKTHRIILVDDGSDNETKSFLENFCSSRESYVTLIRHDKAKAYTKAANAGLKASSADYVILLNSDTVVCDNWILKLIHCAESSENIGVVGPLSNAASWQSVPNIKEKDGSYSVNPLPEGMLVKDVDALCQKYSLSEFPRVQLVNGFCFCIKRSVIKQVGLLDEDSYPKGYNEENDYCFRVSDAGFDLSIATHTYVYHSKSKSYTPKKRIELCEESRKVFEKTYGIDRINRATSSVRMNPFINKIREKIKKEYK